MKPRSRSTPSSYSILGTLHVRGILDEMTTGNRFDVEVAMIHKMTEDDVDALRGILGASDTIELVRKLYRLAAASAEPGQMLVRLLSESWRHFLTFSLELAAFRRFMAKMSEGKEAPRDIAEEIDREDRQWLLELLHDRFGGPSVKVMEAFLNASDRWTLPADDLLQDLIRLSIEIASEHADGEISQQALDQAVIFLRHHPHHRTS